MGKISIVIACLCGPIAVVAGLLKTAQNPADIGPVLGLVRVIEVAELGFAVGLLAGLIGLLAVGDRRTAWVGLLVNSLGEGVSVLVSLRLLGTLWP